MEGPLKDAEADNHSKKDKIETDPSEGDKAEEGKRSEASQFKKDKTVPIEEGHREETPLDAEKGLPTVIPTENAETDPSERDKVEEGKRSEASQSKCSKLQSFIFGSLQKFFMAQVR